jgi:acetolactate synthase-1/2/3 large subunit
VKVDIPIVGDVKDVLGELIARSRRGPHARRCSAQAWWEPDQRVAQARVPEAYKPGQRRRHQAAGRGRDAVGADQGRDAYITSDVGQHQMWAAQYYRFDEPRRWINSGGWAPWAWACPMPWASSWPSPRAEVFCITGEGSIQMCIQELSTCLQYNTPVKIVSLNNRYLGMVRQWQQLDYGAATAHSYMDALPTSSSWPRPMATSAC